MPTQSALRRSRQTAPRTCCANHVTAVFFNVHRLWFTKGGVKYTMRLRQLLDDNADADEIVAMLEARGVYFDAVDATQLRFWVSDSARLQMRFYFDRAANSSNCGYEINFRQERRNRWRPEIKSV